MNNTITLSLGGRHRDMLFNLGTLATIGQVTGTDPFKFNIQLQDFAKFLDEIGTVVYAGLLSSYRKVRKEPDFTIDDCMAWVAEIEDMGEAIKILNAFTSAYKVSGEGNKDTQPGGRNLGGAAKNGSRGVKPAPVGTL